MNVSNFEDVGQMRRSKGISMKTMRNEVALQRVRWYFYLSSTENLHAERAEDNHYADMEEIRDSYGKTEEYTDNSGPTIKSNSQL